MIQRGVYRPRVSFNGGYIQTVGAVYPISRPPCFVELPYFTLSL